VIVLDCLGQRCPLPVIALARKIPSVEVGDIVRVIADDPAAGNDIKAWCRMKGHELVADQGHQFDVRRIS
jgi:tRNA 2-thiouridine synthesizing protein A